MPAGLTPEVKSEIRAIVGEAVRESRKAITSDAKERVEKSMFIFDFQGGVSPQQPLAVAVQLPQSPNSNSRDMSTTELPVRD